MKLSTLSALSLKWRRTLRKLDIGRSQRDPGHISCTTRARFAKEQNQAQSTQRRIENQIVSPFPVKHQSPAGREGKRCRCGDQEPHFHSGFQKNSWGNSLYNACPHTAGFKEKHLFPTLFYSDTIFGEHATRVLTPGQQRPVSHSPVFDSGDRALAELHHVPRQSARLVGKDKLHLEHRKEPSHIPKSVPNLAVELDLLLRLCNTKLVRSARGEGPRKFDTQACLFSRGLCLRYRERKKPLCSNKTIRQLT